MLKHTRAELNFQYSSWTIHKETAFDFLGNPEISIKKNQLTRIIFRC